jgi:uncharacterized protein YndB with AHSA1/START domain
MKSDVKIDGKRLTVTRVFDAPRHLVFGWWTQADKLQQWSGCKEATKCEITMDFRVGGSFTQKCRSLAQVSFRLAVHTTRSSHPKGSSITRILAKPLRG